MGSFGRPNRAKQRSPYQFPMTLKRLTTKRGAKGRFVEGVSQQYAYIEKNNRASERTNKQTRKR